MSMASHLWLSSGLRNVQHFDALSQKTLFIGGGRAGSFGSGSTESQKQPKLPVVVLVVGSEFSKKQSKLPTENTSGSFSSW